jgi:hypothetical protein
MVSPAGLDAFPQENGNTKYRPFCLPSRNWVPAALGCITGRLRPRSASGNGPVIVFALCLVEGTESFLQRVRRPVLQPGGAYRMSNAADAQVALHARACDPLIFSQTVPDAAVKESMASAVKAHPGVRFLVISEEGRRRPFGAPRSRLSF